MAENTAETATLEPGAFSLARLDAIDYLESRAEPCRKGIRTFLAKATASTPDLVHAFRCQSEHILGCAMELEWIDDYLSIFRDTSRDDASLDESIRLGIDKIEVELLGRGDNPFQGPWSDGGSSAGARFSAICRADALRCVRGALLCTRRRLGVADPSTKGAHPMSP